MAAFLNWINLEIMTSWEERLCFDMLPASAHLASSRIPGLKAKFLMEMFEMMQEVQGLV